MRSNSPAILISSSDAVAQVAAALIANDKARLPVDATTDPVAAVLAANARQQMAEICRKTTETIASALHAINSIKLAPAEDVVHLAVRACLHADAVKASYAAEHFEKTLAERSARLARTTYEDSHPKAARFSAWSLTLNLALLFGALSEIGIGAYMLSEVTNAFSGDLAAALFLACVVGTVYEAGYLNGELITHSTKSAVMECLRRAGIVMLSALAGMIAVTLGMIRANLPVAPASLLIMFGDLTTYLPAFALMTVEGAFFLIVTSLTASRRLAGDNRDYHLIVVAETAARRNATALRRSMIREVRKVLDQIRSEILATMEAAASARAKAADSLAEIEATFNAHDNAHNLLVRTTAQTFRQAVLAAHRDIATAGHEPLGAPDFDAQFAALIHVEMPDKNHTLRLKRQVLRIKVRAIRTERLVAQSLSKLDDIMSSLISDAHHR